MLQCCSLALTDLKKVGRVVCNSARRAREKGISRTQVNTLQRLQSELSAAMKSGKTEDISAKVREIQVALGGVNVAAGQYSRLQKGGRRVYKECNQAQKDMLAAARENASAISSLASSFSSLRNNSKGMSRAMSDIKTLALQGGGIYMAKNIFDQIVQQGGQIEQQHIALRSMIGDYQEADKLFNQIKRCWPLSHRSRSQRW